MEMEFERMMEEEEGEREGVKNENRCDNVLIVGEGISEDEEVLEERLS
jgi:hypothetical protein